MKKILIISSSIIVGLLVIITICASFYLYSYALARDNSSLKTLQQQTKPLPQPN